MKNPTTAANSSIPRRLSAPRSSSLPTYPDPATSVNVFIQPGGGFYVGLGIYDGSPRAARLTGGAGPRHVFSRPARPVPHRRDRPPLGDRPRPPPRPPRGRRLVRHQPHRPASTAAVIRPRAARTSCSTKPSGGRPISRVTETPGASACSWSAVRRTRLSAFFDGTSGVESPGPARSPAASEMFLARVAMPSVSATKRGSPRIARSRPNFFTACKSRRGQASSPISNTSSRPAASTATRSSRAYESSSPSDRRNPNHARRHQDCRAETPRKPAEHISRRRVRLRRQPERRREVQVARGDDPDGRAGSRDRDRRSAAGVF